jgi:MtN3 and saliva related transmembrane protein
MDLNTVVGIIASISTAVSSLPQLIKLWKEKKAENVSLGMFAVLVLGLGVWVWYGILKEDWIIIIANGFSFLINLTTFILSIRYKNNTSAL